MDLAKKYRAEFSSITIRCLILDKEVTSVVGDVRFDAGEAYGAMEIAAVVKCDCGSDHEIDLSHASWY